MESVRDLLSFFLKVAIGIFVIVLVIVLTKSVKQSSGTSSNASSTPKADILPSPRKYSGFINGSSTGRGVAQAPKFVPPPTFSFNGTTAFASATKFSYNGPIAFSSTYGNSVNGNSNYNTYTTAQPASQPQTVTALKDTGGTSNLAVRNLSIYQGGHVYTGLSFVGEARSAMFRNGKFPIIVVDATGRVVGVSAAFAQSTLTVPGWVRFETRITYSLPVNAPCTMIFEEALTQAERTRQPVRVSLPIRCN